MGKLLYNGEYIEVDDELEKGYKELDLLDTSNKEEGLENTIEMKSINLDNTLELEKMDLENTQEIELGDING